MADLQDVPNLSIKHLRTVVALARFGSFIAAAQSVRFAIRFRSAWPWHCNRPRRRLAAVERLSHHGQAATAGDHAPHRHSTACRKVVDASLAGISGDFSAEILGSGAWEERTRIMS